MGNTRKKIWYQETTIIACNLEDIRKSLSNFGEHYTELMREYPGMTTVDLIEQGTNYVTIKTNEGKMKRTNIAIDFSRDTIFVEFDEEYTTSKLTTHSHFVEQFQSKKDNVELKVVISDLSAPGVLGFFLRNLGSKNIGNGFLHSYREIFDN